MGLTGLALGAMLAGDGILRADTPGHFVPPDGKPHFAPRAKKVIWLMMRGGVSHMESFDPKPALTEHAGKTVAESPHKAVLESPYFKNVREVVVNNIVDRNKAKIFPLQVGYKKCGQSGVEISDWWPHVRGIVDDIAILRSMWTTDNNHGAQMLFLSGKHMLDGCAPTIGAWTHYGLGTLNENLPQFISMGARLESQCFEALDGDYLGPENAAVEIKVDPKNPLAYGRPELEIGLEERAINAGLLDKLNQLSAVEYPADKDLHARINAYELAFRMQTAVPDVMRFEDEDAGTRKLYGLDNEVTRPFGEQLLAARRFSERGVRFIQVFHGPSAAGEWDAHSKLKENHSSLCAKVDQPIAALITDLKRRGLLDETIVLWTTEFGRTPYAQGGDGRDHHNFGFSIWMAGGGIKGGIVHGATDELGYHAVEKRQFVTDIHATIFQLLGLDPRRLEIPGRKRLDMDYGRPIPEIIA